MKNKKEYCEKLFKKWGNLNKRRGKAQRITTEDKYKELPLLLIKEREELDSFGGKLKDECLDYLSPAERNELER